MEFQTVRSQSVGENKIPPQIYAAIRKYKDLGVENGTQAAEEEFVGRELFNNYSYADFIEYIEGYTTTSYWTKRRSHMRACDAKEHKCFYECPYYNTREVCDTNIFDPSLGKLAKPDFHFIPQKFMELPKAIPTPVQEEMATPKYKIVESKGKSKGKSKRKRKWQTLDAAKVDKEILETEVKDD